MTDIKKSEIRAIEQAMSFPKGFGYVLDFSDRTMSEFFEEEFGIEIYDEQYLANGSSKRNCLTTFLTLSDTYLTLKVLRALWERREGLLARFADSERAKDASQYTDKFKKIIERLECDPLATKSEGVDAFIQERTLEELVADIERTLSANKPEVAIDHLHTYFVKKLTHLLKVRGIECSENEPLHSRFGKYRNSLVQEHSLHEFSDRAMKSSISLLESFNDLRNNHSLAHDNEILDPIEARYIFSSINAVLVLLRALETSRYEE